MTFLSPFSPLGPVRGGIAEEPGHRRGGIPQPGGGRGGAREGTVGEHRQLGTWLGVLVMFVIAGLVGCQAGPRPGVSILDECGRPTAANRDWCFSIRFPSAP